MKKFKDFSSQRFGRLVVSEFDHRDERWKIYWKCICDCGNITTVRIDHLVKGSIKSCGCLQSESRKKFVNRDTRGRPRTVSYDDVALHVLYRNYKGSAKIRGLNFELTSDDFLHLIKGNCYYCGDAPNQKVKLKRYSEEFIYNGVDRVDNTKGYTQENCVPCCGICNQMKMDLSLNDFYKRIDAIARQRIIEEGI